MVRNYKKKGLRALWSTENLAEAVNKIKTKAMTIRQASCEYKIPVTTLRDHVSDRRRNSTGISVIPKHVGRRTVFTEEEESLLKQYCFKLSELYFGLSIEDFRQVAYKFAEKIGVQSRFINKKGEKLAGYDFYYQFRKRHPDISLRSPEPTSLNRIVSFNKSEVDRFYANLSALYEKNKYGAANIYNVDESGVHTVHKPSKILAKKGVKQIGKITSGERGSLVTTICCVSAAGSYVPPFLVFPRKLMNDRLMKNSPPGSKGACSGNGWSNEEIFVEWIKHFVGHVRPSVSNRVCLLLDNHESHISLQSYDIAKENGIDLLSLPPHTSHKIQPLDLVFFGPLKTAFNNQCDYWMKSNCGQRITVYEIAELFGQAYQKVATVEKGVKGFASAGIYPFQPTVFKEEDFAPVNTLLKASANVTASDGTEIKKCVNEQENVAAPSTSTTLNRELQNNTTPPKMTTVNSNHEDIFNLPEPQPTDGKKRKRNVRKKHSEILSSTPMREELVLKESNKIKRKENEAARAKRRIALKDQNQKQVVKDRNRKQAKKKKDSDSENEEIIIQFSDDEVASEDDAEQPFDFNGLIDVPKKDDYVLVEFKIREHNIVYYVGKILTDKDENDEFEISFFRKSVKMQNKFILPAVLDIALIPLTDIKIKLPEPVLHGVTKRQQSCLSFGVAFGTLKVN